MGVEDQRAWGIEDTRHYDLAVRRCRERQRCGAFHSMISWFLLLGLQLLEQGVEALVVPFPQPAVAFQPFRGVPQPLGLEAAGSSLRVAAARDQAGPLEHLEM